MSGGPHETRQVLPAQPSSVRVARHAIRDWLREVGRPDLAEGAELAVSEVVTNALVHAGTAVEVTARLDVGFVRVEVADGNVHLPRAREVSSSSGTGRGLTLLDSTVDRWGAEVNEHGKVVWFELGDVARAAGPVLEGPAADPDAIVVQLLDAPLLLLSAWFEHAGAMLREHLLVRLEEDDAHTVLERHAAAGEVLSLMAEQWPDLTALVGEEMLAGAVEPAVTATRLDLVVPLASVPGFAVLDEVLDEALELADSGDMLTPPTQPEMREMRRWITLEVTHQARGATPRPRRTSTEWTLPTRPSIRWAVEEVDASTAACIAADDTNRIVAVSPAALDLLGHERETLVDSRLIAIIPPRFHQAHLAGFALHLVNGRGPLIGVPVTVPVLRADGTELPVELTINAQRLPEGRSVFVAELARATGASAAG